MGTRVERQRRRVDTLLHGLRTWRRRAGFALADLEVQARPLMQLPLVGVLLQHPAECLLGRAKLTALQRLEPPLVEGDGLDVARPLLEQGSPRGRCRLRLGNGGFATCFSGGGLGGGAAAASPSGLLGARAARGPWKIPNIWRRAPATLAKQCCTVKIDPRRSSLLRRGSSLLCYWT